MKKEFNEAELAAALIASQNALWLAILELADEKGGDGQWFDEFERRAVYDAKNSIAEGMTIEREAEALQFGVDVLTSLLEVYRERLRNFSATP